MRPSGNTPACIHENVPLAQFTTFRIGGPARWFASPRSLGEVWEALAFARENRVPVLVLGGGSNVLVDDAGVDALVIRLDAGGDFSRLEELPGGTVWKIGAAAGFPETVARSVQAGLAGLQDFAGIPGRFGGAVAMNAGGAAGGGGQFVLSAEVIDLEDYLGASAEADEVRPDAASVDAILSLLSELSGSVDAVGATDATESPAGATAPGDDAGSAEVSAASSAAATIGGAERVRTLTREQLGFGYRQSALGKYLALSFLVEFSGRDDPEALALQAREALDRKRSTQPLAFPSAGCMFTNPSGASAGALLDWSGCKGMREGGAEVSGLHANFIVNTGGATCRDVVRLAGRVRRMVLAQHKIMLKPEIRLWGSPGAFRELTLSL